MHLVAVVLVALAGLSCCLAALLRWRLLRAAEASRGYLWAVWVGIVLLSAGLVASLVEGQHRDFAYGTLGVWAAVASLAFVSRFLHTPSRWLLVLPLGGMALLIAMAGLMARPEPPAAGGMPGIVLVHILFMSAHLAAALVAGASAALYLLAVRQLKAATIGALRLPNLPQLDQLFERSLVVSTALLLGGLASGGGAMQLSRSFSLLHPASLLSLANMALLVVALAVRQAHGLGRRGIALGAIASAVVTAIATLALLVDRHG
jgi:hypothetical protein